jgi:23S rRNA (cytosine1962-C5)-methyltransferase
MVGFIEHSRKPDGSGCARTRQAAVMLPLSINPALGALEGPSVRRLAVRVTSDTLRQVRGGHPWIYADSITSISDGGRPGDLAVVFDRDRSFAAIGLFDPDSTIRVKVLHVGSAVPIDVAWWTACLSAARERRRPFLDDPGAEQLAYRIVNGENDGLAGLVVDRYADVLVVKLYSAAWFAHLRPIVDVLADLTSCSAVVLRLARSVQRGETHQLRDGDVIAGTLRPGPVPFLEHGLRFEADVRTGQKTGWFLDQRANRARVGALSANADVLDLFCATGGFSVHAAAGGARSVVSIDQSVPTLAAAEHNMALNRADAAVSRCEHSTRAGDAFEVMAALGREHRHFGLVVVDPPSFAQRQADVDGALRAYRRLTSLAVALVEAGGVLVQASCSSRVSAPAFYDTVVEAARSARRPLVEIERTGHDLDHPIGFVHGEYLKAGFWRVP